MSSWYWIVGVSLLACLGCARGKPVLLEPLRDRAEKTPVVLVPGITGSSLRNTATGDLIWGRTKNLFFPHDGGYDLALPIGPERSTNGVEAESVMLELRLLGFRKQIYGSLVGTMETNGYRRGDIAHPAGESLFLFAYDWRRSVLDATRRLAAALEAMQAASGKERLEVDLICQSNAALICRYLAKYGGASLEQAEGGVAGPPPGVDIRKVIFLGPAHGGALRVLHELHHGRRYLGFLGRRLRPEALFTFDSLFESLPVYRDRFFLGEDGRPLEAEIFDDGSWERFGWSIFDEEATARIEARDRGEIFGAPEDRRKHLRRSLDRARRLHRLLERDPAGFEPPRYYTIQNVYAPTADRGLLVEDDGWKTLFPGDERVRRDSYLTSIAMAPGDGHATVASQEWMSASERAAMARPPAHVPGTHFNFILDPATERHVLEFLLD